MHGIRCDVNNDGPIRVLAEYDRHHPTLQGALKKRIEGQDPGIVRHAWKAQRRLNRTYWKMVAKGKQTPVAATAVARELAGFVWALMVDEDLLQEEAA